MAYTEDLIYVFLCDDHTYDCSVDIIGRAGEGNVTQIAVQLPTNLNGGSVYLDFKKPNGEKFRSPKLTNKSVGDLQVSVYDVDAYLLTEAGDIEVQAVVEMASGKTWKSGIKKYANLESINAIEDIPEKEEANREVISIDLSKFDSDGQITENLADGTKETTTIAFDSSGNPIKITDSNGNETVLTW